MKTKSKLYHVWWAIKTRCYNPKDKSYKDYGGRGITMCDRWLNSLEAFEEDMGNRPVGTSIDRIDPNGNYEPSNCRWATPLQQTLNRRNVKGYQKIKEGVFDADWYDENNKRHKKRFFNEEDARQFHLENRRKRCQ